MLIRQYSSYRDMRQIQAVPKLGSHALATAARFTTVTVTVTVLPWSMGQGDSLPVVNHGALYHDELEPCHKFLVTKMLDKACTAIKPRTAVKPRTATSHASRFLTR